MDPIQLSPGAIAAFVWEFIKWVIRTLLKKPSWSIPVKWNLLAVAVISYLILPLLALLGAGEYQFPTDAATFVKQLLVLILQLLVGMGVHTIALSPASKAAKVANLVKAR